LIVFRHQLNLLTQNSPLSIDLLKGEDKTLVASDPELRDAARQRIDFA
jgi:hypothetical protein